MSEGYSSHTLMDKLREDVAKTEILNTLNNQQQHTRSKKVEFSLEYQKLEDAQVKSNSKVFNNLNEFKKNTKKNTFLTRKMLQKHNKFTSFLQILPKNQHNYRFSFISNQKSNSDADIVVRRQSFIDSSTLSNFSFLQKIERRKKSKDEKCKIVKKFGLNIKTMQINSDIEKEIKKKRKYQNKNLTFQGQSLQGKLDNKINFQPNTTHINQFAKKTILRKKAASFLQSSQARKNQKANDKIKIMVQSSNQLLKTFGCFKFVQPLQKQSNYKFYVGRGNNKNLIVSTFRKRLWWTQTNDIHTADFVWTQLKQPTILSKIEIQNENQAQKTQKNQSQTGPDQHEPAGITVYLQKSQNKKTFKMPQVGHNHITKGYLFGNKKTLFQNLKSYYQYKNSSLLEIIPLTFLVDQVDSKRFVQFQNQANTQKDAIWIVKPGENSNRGRGIFVSNNLEQIKQKMQKRKNNSKHTYIIQKYLTNIFLYQKRKFDIRTYMLLLSINGVTKFYWYKEGYIRTSSQTFDLKNLKNEYIHLTNDAVQIKNSSYGQFQSGNKLSYNQFQQYLDHNFYQKKYSMKNVHEQMKKMSIQAIKSAYHKLDSRSYALELFGLDFIIDNNFKPWLIEINTNPCLQLTSPVLQRIIPSVIENVFRLGIDPIYRPDANSIQQKHCYLYTSCILNNKFQLIFDSLVDRDLKWQEYQKGHPQNNAYEEQKANNCNDQLL